jgi:hypothetical protein
MAQTIEEELSTIQKRITRLEKAVQIVNRNVLRQTTELRKVLVSIERKLG